MTNPVSYKRHRFPPQIIAHAVWLCFRLPLSLRLVEEMLLERGIVVSYETSRRRGRKFGSDYARRLRRKQPRRHDVWHLDEVVISIAGKKHWLWRAVNQDDVCHQKHSCAGAATRQLTPRPEAFRPSGLTGVAKEGVLGRQLSDQLRQCLCGGQQLLPLVLG